MTTTVYPYLPADELKKEEDESNARELSWLLDSLQETLLSLKSGLEECYALLAPIEPGSTLVMSSLRNESVKGHVTRVGSQVVKGTLHLRLKSLPHTHLSVSPTHPLTLPSLTTLRTLLNQSLDCVDITRWTGDRHSADFISAQLRLLHSLLHECIALLNPPSPPSSTTTTSSSPPQSHDPNPSWTHPPDPSAFTPALPPNLSIDLTPTPSSLVLTVRVLELVSETQNLGTKLAFAIGAQRRLEHDEMDGSWVYHPMGGEVRVREKVRVESSADPMLLVLAAKLGALERAVQAGRGCLAMVTGRRMDEDDDEDGGE